jgi:ABC-type transport system substrate-binding protein
MAAPVRGARSRAAKGFLVATASMALLAGGCDDPVRGPLGPESDGLEGPPRRGGWLHMASFTDVRTLDAAVAFDEVSNVIEHLIYAKLIDFSPAGQGFVPDLAERWEQSEDGLRTVFYLRRGALFHDGGEVTAADVKRSIERALHPDTPSPVSSFYSRIKGYDAYTSRKAAHLEGVRVEGELVVAIELSEPDATLLSVMALPTMAPLCRSAGAVYDRDFARKPCGAGPYRLRSWEPGRAVKLERFEGYHDRSRPYLDGIDWSLSMPTFTQRFKFESGELDYVHELTESDLVRYTQSPLWKGRGLWEPSKAVYSVFMNTEMPPFDNAEVRRAVASAIDRDQVAAIRPGSVRPASRLIPPAVPGYDASPGQRYDFAAALEHMRKAGYPYDPATGQGGYPKELVYVGIGDSFDVEAAQIYQQQLARIGIRFRIRALGWPAYLAESARRHTTAFGADGWSADFPDPSDFFEPILSSKAISDEESQNRSFYSNKEFDGLLEQARKEPVWERRLAMYRQAEQMVIDDAPWAISYTKRWFELYHPYLHGYAIHPARSEDVRFVWLDVPARERALSARSALPLSIERLAALVSRWPARRGPSRGGRAAGRGGGDERVGLGQRAPARARAVAASMGQW